VYKNTPINITEKQEPVIMNIVLSLLLFLGVDFVKKSLLNEIPYCNKGGAGAKVEIGGSAVVEVEGGE
jgi:hypothetical protein